MQDERNTPQDEEVEAHGRHRRSDEPLPAELDDEVEAHGRHRRSEEPAPAELDDDDEVEAHFRHHSPVERKAWHPSE